MLHSYKPNISLFNHRTMLRNLTPLLFAFLFSHQVLAQAFTPSDADSKLSFVIKNMGIGVDGIIKGLKGKIIFNPKNLKSSLFDVTVDVSTINTDNKKRDAHLMKDDFFDAAKYPTIHIKTTSIQPKSANTYFAKALLTMHGVTKPIQFDFVALPANSGYRFNTQFTLNRRDYGVGGNSMTLSDDVKVSLDVVSQK